jgi:purine-binding chemotaxis protein CheW
VSETVATTNGKSWDVLGRAAAAQRSESADVLEVQQFLTFVLDGTPYALPIERVQEIVRIRPTTPIPRAPEDVRGVISLRGEIVQVIDLRRRLGLETLAPTRSNRVIVVHGGDGRMAGLLVDTVTEVLTVTEDALRQPSGDTNVVEALCVRGDQFVSLVNLDRVLAIDAGE